MKAAVIIPVFNEGERVLRVADAALESVSTQEVFVVDDGSTDNTAEVLAERDDITVLSHSHNKGKGEALDSGMQIIRARGYEAAVFLDGDLLGIEPGHIDQLMKPLKEDESYMSIGYLGLRKAVVQKAILSRWVL